MPSSTDYNPTRVMDFEASKLVYNGQGVSASMTIGTTTNLDYTFVDDCLVTGFYIVSNGGTFGDRISLQVVDMSGAFTGTPGTVMAQLMTNIRLPPVADKEFKVAYPRKALTGMGLRVSYTSTAILGLPVFFAINYELHKVLV